MLPSCPRGPVLEARPRMHKGTRSGCLLQVVCVVEVAGLIAHLQKRAKTRRDGYALRMLGDGRVSTGPSHTLLSPCECFRRQLSGPSRQAAEAAFL